MGKNAKVITDLGRKGGVGKTTTIVELAFCLAADGSSVLVIDQDGQGNATRHITGSSQSRGVYDLYLDEEGELDWKDLIVDATPGWGRIVVLPGTSKLDTLDTDIQERFQRELILRERMKEIRPTVDWVLIDNPPVLDQRVVNALCAADYYFTPIDLSEHALQGARSVLKFAEKVKKQINPDLKLLATLVTRYEKANANVNRLLLEELKELSPDKYWGTIPSSVRVAEAQRLSKSVQAIEPEGRVAESYRSFAEYVRMEGISNVEFE